MSKIRAAGAAMLAAGAVGVLAVPAAGAATVTSKSCQIAGLLSVLGGEPALPVPLADPLDPGTVARFAVLRRAAGPQDALAAVNPLGSELSFELSGYYPSSIRQLQALPDGRRFILIAGLKAALPIPPARCLPPPLRAKRPKLVEEQAKLASAPSYCVAPIAPRPGIFSASARCRTFAAIDTGLALAEGAFSPVPIVDLVPDGVAAIRVSYRDGTSRMAPVSENAFTFKAPEAPIVSVRRAFTHLLATKRLQHPTKLSKRERKKLGAELISSLSHLEARIAPSQVQWLDTAGDVLRTFKPKVGGGTSLLSLAGAIALG